MKRVALFTTCKLADFEEIRESDLLVLDAKMQNQKRLNQTEPDKTSVMWDGLDRQLGAVPKENQQKQK
ncbi:hypothetical protein QE152_g35653 [Popillia japonica]|uniref:Uncharacterized protein n=1 Tax=Popillia japonica TaxID=7064 RepID=A0AAW1IFM4_POPJA